MELILGTREIEAKILPPTPLVEKLWSIIYEYHGSSPIQVRNLINKLN